MICVADAAVSQADVRRNLNPKQMKNNLIKKKQAKSRDLYLPVVTGLGGVIAVVFDHALTRSLMCAQYVYQDHRLSTLSAEDIVHGQPD